MPRRPLPRLSTFANHPVVTSAAIVFLGTFIGSLCAPHDSTIENVLLIISLPMIPIWLPSAMRWEKRERRRRQGLCTKCGYDLTGNVSGTCPECGGKIG
jgi:hypothetical protein